MKFTKGINGSGKTTTFKIVTGEIEPSKGDVFINGYSIKKQEYKARQSLGYCPQFDCLPEYLTVKESIYLYAKLRGVDGLTAKQLTHQLIKIFQLNEFEKVMVQNLR